MAAGHAVEVLCALLEVVEALLTAGGCAAPAPVPSHAVLLLVTRMLKLDGAGGAGRPAGDWEWGRGQ